MNVESWITVEETPALAQAAREAIEARLARFSAGERDAFWASIVKAYNTPYNDPVKKPAAPQPVEPAPVVELVLPEIELPTAAIAAAALAGEIRAV